VAVNRLHGGTFVNVCALSGVQATGMECARLMHFVNPRNTGKRSQPFQEAAEWRYW
jgi:hypothetical protein